MRAAGAAIVDSEQIMLSLQQYFLLSHISALALGISPSQQCIALAV